MNIIVRPYDSSMCYCRPDTTWERENKDFYVPGSIDVIDWAPILFVRISKAGKCIGKKFASRYYDAFNYGALLYCRKEGSDEIAFTSCADHSSLLPAPLYNPVVLESPDNIFEVSRNGEASFAYPASGKNEPAEGMLKEMIEDTICRASEMTSVRIGDYIAIELVPAGILATREEGDVRFQARYCENSLYDLNIIF